MGISEAIAELTFVVNLIKAATSLMDFHDKLFDKEEPTVCPNKRSAGGKGHKARRRHH